MAADRWGPWVRLTTPGVLLPYTVTQWVVHSEEGMHPWAQLTVRYQLSPGYRAAADRLPPTLWWAEDTAVEVTWGSTPAAFETFVGYVVSPELLSVLSTQQQPYVSAQMLDVRYTLLGATKPLQTARTRTWRQCSVAYMAGVIAAANGLASVTDPHPRVFDVRIQAAESDFAFLRARAAESGYRLSVSGTTLYLTDPRRPLVASVPEVRQSRTPGTADTMQAFRAVAGETDPAGAIRARHTAVALTAAGVVTAATAESARTDPVSGARLAPQVGRHATGYVAGSHAAAAAIADAAALTDLWWVSADATVDGDVRLRAGCAVTLGGDAVAPQYAGTWMTRSAHHRMTISALTPRLSTYYVDLTLGRDQASSASLSPYAAPPAYASVLAGGRWTATRTATR